jgi:hypothetical protein
MINYIIEHKNSVIVYIVVHILTYLLFIHVLGKNHIKNNKNKELMGKLEPYKRIDVDNWSIIMCFPFYITFWPRMILALFNLIFFTLFINIAFIGVDTTCQ